MSDYSDVQASYGRCVRNRDFIPGFYQRLLSKDKRIAAIFKRTNWSVQNRALRRGISIALTWAGGSKIVDRQLEEMADAHSRKGRVPVDPVLYVFLREALKIGRASCRERVGVTVGDGCVPQDESGAATGG